MNRTRATGLSNNGRIFRHPLLVASIVSTGLIIAGIQYKRMAIARNEQAQRNGQEPNFYVSVDRSGGGI